MSLTIKKQTHGTRFRGFRTGMVERIMNNGILIQVEIGTDHLDALAGAENITGVKLNGIWLTPATPMHAAHLQALADDPYDEVTYAKQEMPQAEPQPEPDTKDFAAPTLAIPWPGDISYGEQLLGAEPRPASDRARAERATGESPWPEWEATGRRDKNGGIQMDTWTPKNTAAQNDPRGPEPGTNSAIPCHCGNPESYWLNYPAGRREAHCTDCHAAREKRLGIRLQDIE